MKEVGARDLGKARNLCLCWVFGRKQPTIDVGKAICPTRQVSVPLVFGLRIHRTENLANHLMGVGGIPCAHPFNRAGKTIVRMKDIRVLGEEAEEDRKSTSLN